MKKLILIFFAVLIFSGIGYAQVNNLTDRELLIQLYTKVDGIEKTLYKITTNNESTQKDIYVLDRRVTTNETNFASFCKRFDDLTIRWNALIAVFFASLLGMVVWVVRNSYVIRKENNKPN